MLFSKQVLFVRPSVRLSIVALKLVLNNARAILLRFSSFRQQVLVPNRFWPHSRVVFRTQRNQQAATHNVHATAALEAMRPPHNELTTKRQSKTLFTRLCCIPTLPSTFYVESSCHNGSSSQQPQQQQYRRWSCQAPRADTERAGSIRSEECCNHECSEPSTAGREQHNGLFASRTDTAFLL